MLFGDVPITLIFKLEWVIKIDNQTEMAEKQSIPGNNHIKSPQTIKDLWK